MIPLSATVTLHWRVFISTNGHKEREPSEIEAVPKIDHYNAAARHWVAVSMNLSGDSTAARKLFTETLARHPRFFPSQMYLGELARQQGDSEDSFQIVSESAISNVEFVPSR